MTPDNFTAALTDRLRRQGGEFDPADLEAFVADVRQTPATDGDIEALAQRFRDSQASAARARTRKRVRAWVEGMCIAGIGAVLVGFGALFMLGGIFVGPAMGAGAEVLGAMALIGAGLSAGGAALIIRGLIGPKA